jgi:cytoskeletal protein RodZ
MRFLTWLMLTAAALSFGACGSQEQPPTAPAPPAVTAPPQTPPPAPAAEPAAPAAVPAEPEQPKSAVTEPPPAPPVTPAAPAKPAVQNASVPDTIVLESKQGQISFPHLAHAKDYSCATCHGDGTPGGLALPMDVAHSLCRDCHKAKGAGPTTCAGCHKK